MAFKEQQYGLREDKSTPGVVLGYGRSKKILIAVGVLGTLFVVFSFLLTQKTAGEFQSARFVRMEKPLISTGSGIKIHQPFLWINWYRNYKTHHLISSFYNYHFRFYGSICGLIIAVIILYLVAMKHLRGDVRADLHGTARLAKIDDIKKMGLLEPKGAAVGGFVHKKDMHYLYHDGPEHIMCFAPTRSGKGVGLVIPTLLSWPHSMIVYDLKKENWSASAMWRKQYADNHVIRFEPGCSDGSSAKFNPLEEIDLNTDRDVSQAQNIATMIIDDTGKGLDDYWAQSGFDFMTGVILHVAYKAANEGTVSSLPDIAYAISDPEHEITDLLEDMLNYPHKDGETHPAVAQSARTMANKADREQSGVLGTVVSKLNLYRDPIVSKNVSTSDFKVSDIMNADKPVSLYICVGATDKDRLRPLTRLVFSLMLRGLTPEILFEGGRAKESYKHRCLILFDEFPSVGKLDIFQESLAFLAGYGIKCYLIVQDLSQLRAAYTKEESVMSNCHVRIAYAPNKMDTAEELSKMTGVTTIVQKKISTSSNKGGTDLKHSYQYSEQKRNLMTADEVMRIKGIHSDARGNVLPGDMLIFVAGEPLIYGTQILYFKDEMFLARAKLGAPDDTDKIRINGQLIETASVAKQEQEDARVSDAQKPITAEQVYRLIKKQHYDNFETLINNRFDEKPAEKLAAL